MTTGKKVLIGLGVLIVFGAFAGFGAYQVSQDPQRNAIPAEIVDVYTETITTKVSAKGTVEIVDSSTVYAKSTAKVKDYSLKTGDAVKKGQVLLSYEEDSLKTLRRQLEDAEANVRSARLQLDSARLGPQQAEIKQADMSVKQAKKNISDMEYQLEQMDSATETLQKNLDTATENYQKNLFLFQSGFLAQSELDKIKTQIEDLENQLESHKSKRDNTLSSLDLLKDSLSLAETQYNATVNRLSDDRQKNQIALAQLSVEQAERQVARLQEQIDDYVLEETAPQDGILLSANATKGGTVSQGSPLFVIADVSNKNLVVSVNVPENEAKDITTGQDVELKTGVDKIYKGKVTKISPTAEKKQIGTSMETAVTLQISLLEETGLKAGFTLDTYIITKVSENAVCVPLIATMLDADGSYYVYVVNSDMTVSKRTVELLTYSNLSVEVTGVSVGESVVTNPSPKITEGSYVRYLGGLK